MALGQASSSNLSSQLLHPELVLNAVKQARIASQPQLREQLKLVREDIEQCRQSTRNPLHLFPAEVWLMIAKNTKDIKDVANCAQSNNLLLNVFATPQELLFCKVLPHLVLYFGENPATTVLHCGKVCRMWRSAVDRFADHSFRVQTPPRNGIEVVTKESLPQFRFQNILNDDKLRVQDYPFLTDLDLPPFPFFNNRLLTLDSVGHCLWKLSLEFEILETYQSSQIYAECVKAIRKCANLKCFRLSDPSTRQETANVYDSGVDEQLELQVPSALESLEMVVKSPYILAVQNVFLQKLSKQLKRLEVHHWNFKVYPALQWTNLIVLEILNKISLETLDCLQQMTAPKLWKLYIHWNPDLNFGQLVNVVNKFDNLRHLSILLTEAVTENNLTVPIEILTINNLTTLEIFSQDLSEGLNIPVLFPLLRHLVCHYGSNDAEKYKEFKGKETTTHTTKTYIQIYKNMYHSNVWTMLPKLETFTLNLETTTNNAQRRFTRLGYVWSTEKYAQGVQVHMTRIREKLKEIERTKLKLEQNSMQIAPPRSRTGQENMDQSFTIIMPFLDKKDILSCRLVCKHWTNSVGDSILENCMRYNPLTFSVPLSSQQILQNFVSFAEDKSRKAFSARAVEIKITEEIGCVDGIEMILSDLGKHIRHLTISTKIRINLIHVYNICLECMEQCPNLKRFSLRIPSAQNNTIPMYDQLKTCSVISKPVHLTSLSFHGECFWSRESGLCALRQHLKEIFADQIRSLVVQQITNPIFKNPNLKIRELIVTNFKSESVLQLALPWYGSKVEQNLRKLRVCITQEELCNRDLRDIIVHCKELEFLELQFTTACFTFDKNLVYWDRFVSKSVTEFQIVFKNKYQICLDFLVHFPGIQTLRIVYGRHAVLLNEEVDSSENEHNVPYFGVRSPENDFIQLVRFFKDENVAVHDTDKIYASNIWSVLPRLKQLEIVYYAKKHNRDQKVFYRKS